MSAFKLKVIDNIICSELTGALDATLANQWINKLEEAESGPATITRRFHDVRNVNAVNVDFDSLWSLAQRRINTLQNGNVTLTAFWVSTPLNYGVSRMYQSLTDGSSFKIGIFYKLDEIADYLDVNIKFLENITY